MTLKISFRFWTTGRYLCSSGILLEWNLKASTRLQRNLIFIERQGMFASATIRFKLKSLTNLWPSFGNLKNPTLWICKAPLLWSFLLFLALASPVDHSLSYYGVPGVNCIEQWHSSKKRWVLPLEECVHKLIVGKQILNTWNFRKYWSFR